MATASTGTLDRRSDRHRMFAWLGFLVLLLSLLAPQLSIESAEATQGFTTQQECDEGFVFNARTGECEREPQRVPGQITTECPEGTVRERETGACIPIPETTVPETDTPVVTETSTEVPETEPATEVATEVPALVGYAQAIKRACPEGFLPDESTTVTELQDTCLDPIEGVPFHIMVGDSTHSTVPTDATGLSQLGSAPASEIALVEDVPAGYSEPIVYCAEGYAFGPFEHTYTEEDRQPVLNGNAIAWTLPADTLLQCYFYNIVAEDSDGPGNITTQNQAEGGEVLVPSITNHKTRCPQGAPHEELSFGELEELCDIVMEEVEFTFDDGVVPFTVETDSNGDARWISPPAGKVTITETIPDGYGTPYVVCRIGEGGPGLGQVVVHGQVEGGVLELDLGNEPVSRQCSWTNVPIEGDESDNATVTVIKHRCPLGVPEDATIDQYITICTAHFEGIDFTLSHAGGSFPATTADDGQATWLNVPTGDTDVQEDIPEGYKDPLAFCDWFDGENVLQSGQTDATGGLIELDIPADATEIVCNVFNIQDENANSLTVHKWECPAGFDENANDPEIGCTTPLDGVTFTLGDLAAVSGDAGPGTALFTGIPDGDYGLTEVLPDGYERAFFGGCTKPGLEGPGPLAMIGQGENVPTVGLTFEGGDHWECDWYNVPEAPEDNRITLRKWICPPGASHDEDQGWYESNCIQQHNGVTFKVTYDGGSSSAVTLGGAVVFYPVPAGNVTIEEDIPIGYGEPVVFCSVDNQWTQHDVSNPIGEWQHEFPNDGMSEQLNCYIFNVLSENRTVIAHKFTCPAGLEPESEDFEDWQDTCDGPAGGVEFTLTDTNGESTKATSAAGWVPFHNVAQGEVSLTEHTPPGYQPAIVYCSLLAFDASGGVHNENTGIAQTEGTISRTIDYPGFLWSCWFFNVPIDPEDNGVEIHKWQCPEGTEPGQPVDWYEANCVLQHDGVEFTVTSDIGIAVQETAGGMASFPGLPAGGVSIQETIPDGFGPPMVFCGIEGNPQHYPAPTGYWEYDFPNDGLSETLVCWVFNIPGESPDLTITKWTCPPGYDFEAAGSDPKMECTEATDGVTFELQISGQAAIEESQTTGDVIPGGVIFDDLQPDSYRITELVPPGIASVFVLECTGHIMGVLQPEPLSTDEVLDNIDLDPGEHLVCDWYNVPEHEGGRVIVTKHICATETFVSVVDCEIYEGGATFDLLWWDGAAWQVSDTGITDGAGRITWVDLASGVYWLDEHDGEWCHIEVYPPPTGDDSFDVDGGEDTLVDVYNCDPDWTSTTIPEKYPNTGVPPDDVDTPGPNA